MSLKELDLILMMFYRSTIFCKSQFYLILPITKLLYNLFVDVVVALVRTVTCRRAKERTKEADKEKIRDLEGRGFTVEGQLHKA